MSEELEDQSRHQVRRFCRRCFVFAAPLIGVTLPPLAILSATRESFVDIDAVIEEANEKPVLVGFAYNEQNYGYLKYRRLMTLPKQDVVAIGSSRVLGFREEMFTGDFYNAGFTIVSPWDFRSFLDQIPDEKLPATVLLGLDQFMFNRTFNEERPPKSPEAWTATPHDGFREAVGILPDVYKHLVRGEIDVVRVAAHALSPSEGRQAVGMNALLRRQGFRNDGSMLYGSQIDLLLEGSPEARDFAFADSYRRIERGRDRFEWADEPDEDSIAEIAQLLNYCSDRGVKVVAFLPPYADAVWDKMRDSGRYGYLEKLEPLLKQTFNRHNAEIYTFHTMRTCQASDAQVIDGFHAGEHAYARMLQAMVEQGSVLRHYVDAGKLASDLRHVANRYQAYPEPGSVDRIAVNAEQSPR